MTDKNLLIAIAIGISSLFIVPYFFYLVFLNAHYIYKLLINIGFQSIDSVMLTIISLTASGGIAGVLSLHVFDELKYKNTLIKKNS